MNLPLMLDVQLRNPLQEKKKDFDKPFSEIIKLSFATIRVMCIYMFCYRIKFSVNAEESGWGVMTVL